MATNGRSALIVVAVVFALAAPVGLTAYLTRNNGNAAPPPAASVPTYGDGRAPEAHDLRLANIQVPQVPGKRGTVSVEILDQTGQPVSGMIRDHTKLVHLYLVRRDMTVFRHLYPRLANGTWATTTTLPVAGSYRVIVEFTVDAGNHDDHVILGDQVDVPGPARPGPMMSQQPAAGMVVEGAGEAIGSRSLRLWFTGRSGGPVTLGKFLGTTAHIVAFHGPTGAMVRLGPTGTPTTGKNGTFVDVRAELRDRGPYLLFAQVRLDGKAYTLPVAANIQ